MKVLVTAGQVYGRLDDNKLVGNRIRGVWACRFATYLSVLGHDVTLLVPDTMVRPLVQHQLGKKTAVWNDLRLGRLTGHPAQEPPPEGKIEVKHHTGFDSYRDRCWELAETHDAAVMAAAVVNWIPAEPIKGKMDTTGYKPGDRIDIPFVLAESVIGGMRQANPKLHLIGCKMLSGAAEDALLAAARKVILASKAHVVVANDMRGGLRRKLLVYPDGCVQEFNDDWDSFYLALTEIIRDEHWQTAWTPGDNTEILSGRNRALHEKQLGIFDTVADMYRDRMTSRDIETVHGAILVPCTEGYICTPRVKAPDFTSKDAVWVAPEYNWGSEGARTIIVGRGAKATMNAPLLVRMARKGGTGHVVLHLHEQLDGVPTLPYAPPGTVRDNEREIPDGLDAFNIEGHGFIARLDFKGNIMKG